MTLMHLTLLNNYPCMLRSSLHTIEIDMQKTNIYRCTLWYKILHANGCYVCWISKYDIELKENLGAEAIHILSNTDDYENTVTFASIGISLVSDYSSTIAAATCFSGGSYRSLVPTYLSDYLIPPISLTERYANSAPQKSHLKLAAFAIGLYSGSFTYLGCPNHVIMILA